MIRGGTMPCCARDDGNIILALLHSIWHYDLKPTVTGTVIAITVTICMYSNQHINAKYINICTCYFDICMMNAMNV